MDFGKVRVRFFGGTIFYQILLPLGTRELNYKTNKKSVESAIVQT
jgi:hypothetical protein